MTPFLRKRLRRHARSLRMAPGPAESAGQTPLNATPLSQGTRVPVAVIVIGYNAAEFLAECLASIFAQTVTPDEIIFVDDASTDATLAVAETFRGRGLTIVARPGNGGMVAARTTGVEASTAPLLLFVDGDNVLPPDYIATMAAELRARPDAAFTVPGKRFFGEPEPLAVRLRFHPTGEWRPAVASRADLWRQNHCDTCALVRREAFAAAGGWRDNPADTMFDWDLFLRISARHPYLISSATLGYRVHTDNWSERERGRSRAEMFGLVRRRAASLTVATIWSGRLAGDHSVRWHTAVAASLRQAGHTAELLILDDSEAGFPLQIVDRDIFPQVSHRRVRQGELGTGERRPDRRATAEFLAGLCHEAFATATGDILWLIEDDIIVPEHAADLLLRELLQEPGAPHAVVCGAYKSRHPGQRHWIAADVTAEGVRHWTKLPRQTTPVTLTGTGCLMLLRDLVGDVRFSLEWQHRARRSPAHDWAFAWAMSERGTPVRLVPGVVCGHEA